MRIQQISGGEEGLEGIHIRVLHDGYLLPSVP